MSYIKKIFVLLFLFSFYFQVNAWIFSDQWTIPYSSSWYEGWVNEIKDHLTNIETTKTLSEYIQDIVKYLLTFISIVAVVYIIYAWFRVLTSNWSEDSLKKSRTTIVYVIIWIIIIWLAWSIVLLILNILNLASV